MFLASCSLIKKGCSDEPFDRLNFISMERSLPVQEEGWRTLKFNAIFVSRLTFDVSRLTI